MSTFAYRIGMTGTREGMTPAQAATFIDHLAAAVAVNDRPVELIHGDCVGADRDAWMVATAIGVATTAYPSTADAKWHANTPSTVRRERRPSLNRNRAIVDDCVILYAFPKAMQEELRSGTWFTVRHARTIGRRLVIIWPDGTDTVENLL